MYTLQTYRAANVQALLEAGADYTHAETQTVGTPRCYKGSWKRRIAMSFARCADTRRRRRSRKVSFEAVGSGKEQDSTLVWVINIVMSVMMLIAIIYSGSWLNLKTFWEYQRRVYGHIVITAYYSTGKMISTTSE